MPTAIIPAGLPATGMGATAFKLLWVLLAFIAGGGTAVSVWRLRKDS